MKRRSQNSGARILEKKKNQGMAHRPLLTAHCLLLTAHRSPPTTHCPLPTAYCLLPHLFARQVVGTIREALICQGL
ncbi:MAG: hypothetical protein ABIH23_21185 [bacterium]